MNNGGYNKNQNRNNGGNRSELHQPKEKRPFIKLTKMNYVDLADKRMETYKDQSGKITTTKIRSLLSLILEIYTMVQTNGNKQLSEDVQSKVSYIKMKFAYEAGRDSNVKKFIEDTQLMENLAEIRDSKEYLLLVCRYMESLVAYYKFYGGKD